ncbi:hypothetical protein KKB58_01845 [Patescibacteria group bacterium]|nr:hypothetical protein [Patescibacteria group bacterium]
MKEKIPKIIISLCVLGFLIIPGLINAFDEGPSPITTKNPTSVTDTSAIFNGELDSLYRVVWFQYIHSNTSPIIDQRNMTGPTGIPASETPRVFNSSTQIGITVTGLSKNKQYYYRLCYMQPGLVPKTYCDNSMVSFIAMEGYSEPSQNISFGNIGSIISDQIISGLTGNATNVDDISARLNGSISTTSFDLTLPTTGYFRYSTMQTPPVFCNDIYGSDMVSTPDRKLSTTSGAQAFYENISNLDYSTTYYYCAIVSNKKNIAYGEVKKFTTMPCATCAQTAVETTGSQVVSSTSAWLKGKYSSTKALKTYFEYREISSGNTSAESTGTTRTMSTWTKIQSSEQNHISNSFENVSFLLSGLKANTKYDFRLIGETKENPPEILGNNSYLSFKTFSFGAEPGGMIHDPGVTPGNSWIYAPTGGTSTTHTTTADTGTTPGSLILGQIATPPVDAIVRSQEGIEDVFIRQIIGNTSLAKMYGYRDGQDVTAFASNLADLFARAFGYIGYNGKEIRVSFPDLAAYQLVVVGSKLYVYEYFNEKIVNVQIMTEILRNNYDYEYYFFKR